MGDDMTITAFYNEHDFLAAWKEGVKIAGRSWFSNCGVDLDTITSKWDLVPQYEKINESVGYLSEGERVFLLAMYSFYNSSMRFHDFGPANPGALAAGLDEKRRRVLADLLISYTGW